VLALIVANPGITIPEIPENMGIKQNYLYRILQGSLRTDSSSRTAAAGSSRTPPKRRAVLVARLRQVVQLLLAGGFTAVIVGRG
jgi:hypothetical protein